MEHIDQLKSHLIDINANVHTLCRMIHKSPLSANLALVNHIERDEKEEGAKKIDFYEVQHIDERDKDTLIDKIRLALLPKLRDEFQHTATRLIGVVSIDCSIETENEIIQIIEKINQSKADIGVILKHHYEKMHERMKFLQSPGTPLYGVIMDTVHRKISFSNTNEDLYIKSVTFNWSEKSYKSFEIKNLSQFQGHLIWYGKTETESLEIWNTINVCSNEKLVTFLPQRVHPVANISYANIQTNKVIRRYPKKAHTPIFTFARLGTNSNRLENYVVKRGMKTIDDKFIPALPEYALYTYKKSSS